MRDFPAFLDSTAVSEFSACEQKWLYSSIECLTRDSIHLHFGGAYARGLEVMRTAFYERGESVEAALIEGQIALIKFWGGREPLTPSQLHPEARSPKCLETCVGALDYYVSVWNPMLDPVVPARLHPTRRAIEFTFALPLPGCNHPVTNDPILYTGRCDMIADYNGALYPHDDKTASQLGASWANQWDLRGQFIGYKWACREYGHAVPGMIVRGVSILKNGFGNAQTIIAIDDWKVDQWLDAVQRKYSRMVEAWKSNSPIRNFSDSCASFSGCQFTTLCNSPQPDRWKGEYDKRNWNPLDKTPPL